MTTIAILGGSVVGSVAALQFARSGWQVALIDTEFDRLSGPKVGAEPRPGAPHTVQPHGFMARTRVELASRLPDVLAALLAAGVREQPLGTMMHARHYDGGRPGDEDLTAICTRRVTMDGVLADLVAQEPGIQRIHQRATGLVIEDGTPPRVTGLGLDGGNIVTADMVLDAGGRRSPVHGWLAGAGHHQPVTEARCGLHYYSRQFLVRGTERPQMAYGIVDVHEFPTHLQMLVPGDNDTVTVGVCIDSGDPLLKQLRHPGAYHAVLAANEAYHQWLELLEPITPVYAFGTPDNRMRSLVADGRPVVLGLHQAGDSLATTNPIAGRGVGTGLAAVGKLHDLALTHGPDAEALTMAYAAWQRDVLAVYYREAAASSVTLGRKFRANLAGDTVPPNAPRVELPDGHPVSSTQIEQAAMSDPDLFRHYMRAFHMIDDERAIASPAVAGTVRRLLAEMPAPRPRASAAGSEKLHDREALESLLAPYA